MTPGSASETALRDRLTALDDSRLERRFIGLRDMPMGDAYWAADDAEEGRRWWAKRFRL